MEVVIDRKNCGKCLLCADICPDVFDMYDGEIAVLDENVPTYFQADCRFAAEACPNGAIKIREAIDIL